MNALEAKTYKELSQQVLADDFRIEDNLGEKMECLAHFLCEAKRYSAHGLGGSAFRCWVAGVFRQGVYVYADTYMVSVAFASVPTAVVSPGCQDSCAHGDPWPRLSVGRWVHITDRTVPDAVREKVLGIANKLIRDAAGNVLNQIARLQAELAAQKQQRAAAHAAMVTAWTGEDAN